MDLDRGRCLPRVRGRRRAGVRHPGRWLMARPGGGIGDFLAVSGNLAKAAGAITRRLTVDIAETTVETGKEVFEGARTGKSSSEIATLVLSGWFDGARQLLGFDEELQRMGKELRAAAKPMAVYVPSPVKDVAQQVSELAPVRAMTELTGMTGMTVTDVRRNLRQQGMELLRRSTALDDPEEHPAMAMILREISPDEARLVRYLGERGPQAVVDVVAHNPMTRKRRELVHDYSIVGREAGCIRPDYAPIYLDNLARLGVAVVRDYRLRSQPNYDLLYCQPEVQEVKKPEGRIIRLKIVHKGVELSDFGKELFKQCLETETSHLATVPDKL
ncbi:MAG: DUF4393 domain-containing protein [Actinophytocola sp.]|nr:DUF4393 domain-containing protein [Actinophytocola sp.]